MASNKTQKLRLPIDHLIAQGFAISGSRSILQNANLADSNIIFFDIDKKTHQDLSALLNKISKAQDKFFEKTSNNNLFVFINNQSNHNSYYGTLIGGNTTLYLLPKIFNVNDFRVKHLLGHENLHKWIGSNLVKKNEECQYKWFTEGFTRYFTDKINLNNGIITFEEYLDNYNKILRKYYTSPYLAVDNENLSKLYWKDSQAQELPYNRGYIIAQELDLKIQKTTTSRSSLDNIIKITVKNHLLSEKPKFTIEDMVRYINYITKNNFKYTINKFVKYGNFDLNNSFPNKAKLCYKKIKINEYGFDIATPQKIVRNLKINTEAYRAGLRNYDKFKYVSTSQKDPKSIAKIIIELTNGKLIKYQAKKKSVSIPEYGIKCTDPKALSTNPKNVTLVNKNVNNSSLQEIVECEIFHEIDKAQQIIPQKCSKCCWYNACGGGNLVSRFSEKDRFNNHSIYCQSLEEIYAQVTAYLINSGISQKTIADNLLKRYY